MAKLDILLATYNGEKYLKEQLDSILNQTYKDFNLIISDDCSKDKTQEILSDYQKKDKRIKIYYQKKNLGYRKNFEFLCTKSKADYCMFSDQDDVWEKEKIEKMMEIMEKNQYTLMYCDLKITDANLNVIHPSMIRYMKKQKQCGWEDYRAINLDNVVTGCGLITTKEVIQEALPFPEKIYVHDWWIALIATQLGTIHYLDIPLVKYRQHEKNSIGIRSQDKIPKEFEKYRESIIEFHKSQYEICKNRISLFNPSYQKIIIAACDYFNALENKNQNQIRHIKEFYTVHQEIPTLRKIKLFLMFHYPSFAKILYNLREELSK